MKKYLIVLYLIVLCGQNAFVQAQGWEKLFEEGSAMNDIILTPDHKVFSVGFSRYCRLLDSLGNVEWTHTVSLPERPTLIGGGKAQVNEQGNFLVGSRMSIDTPGTDSTRNSRLFFTEYDRDGNPLWSQWVDPLGRFSLDVIDGIQPSSDGGWLVIGKQYRDTVKTDFSNDPLLFKLSGAGDLEWSKILTTYADKKSTLISLFAKGTAPDTYHVLLNSNGENAILDIDATGTISKEVKVRFPAPFIVPFQVVKRTNGYSFFSTSSSLLSQPTPNYYQSNLYQVDTDLDGVIENEGQLEFEGAGRILELAMDEAGNRYLVFGAFKARFFRVLKIDKQGATIWESRFDTPFSNESLEIQSLEDGGAIVAMRRSRVETFTNRPFFLVSRDFILRLDSLGNTFTNQVFGNIFEDLDQDCTPMVEDGLNQWFVRMEGNEVSYARTDSMGNYNFRAEAGDYELKPISTSPYWEGCQESYPLTVGAGYDTLEQNVPVQSRIECPYLEVDIGIPFLRRCFEGTYTVQYANNGTIAAEDAYIEILLDPYLSYISATRPLEVNGDVLRLDLGTVDPEESGRFQFTVLVDCDSTVLGQTHCVEAHIYPDSICLPADNWSGASVEVDAVCAGDSVRFIIRNVGTAPTTIPVNYIIVEDQVLLRQGDAGVILPGGQVIISIPADGSTYNLAAEQEPNHPGNDRPTVTIEGCGGEGNDFRLGFFNQFQENDGDPFVSIECRQSIGSFDPNDKQGFPKGIGAEHYIEPNTDIEYLIRFQNTGTDTAFNVRIVDRLVEELDILSIRPGASSHPYRMEILDGRTLMFHFDNILLLDSFANEPASHGFVKFKVKQKKDLRIGTIVLNAAAIYFDFNDPVITNKTTHEIGRPLLLDNIEPGKSSPAAITHQSWPNPTSDNWRLELSGLAPNTRLSLPFYNLNGQLIKEYTINGNTFETSLADWPSGIYFYKIIQGKEVIGRGKVAVVKEE